MAKNKEKKDLVDDLIDGTFDGYKRLKEAYGARKVEKLSKEITMELCYDILPPSMRDKATLPDLRAMKDMLVKVLVEHRIV